MTNPATQGRHRGGHGGPPQRQPGPSIAYGGEYPGWLLYVVVAALMATTVVFQPSSAWGWCASAVGVAGVVSALASRNELGDADAWRTGDRVRVSWPRWVWLNLYRAPLFGLILAAGGCALAATLSGS